MLAQSVCLELLQSLARDVAPNPPSPSSSGFFLPSFISSLSKVNSVGMIKVQCMHVWKCQSETQFTCPNNVDNYSKNVSSLRKSSVSMVVDLYRTGVSLKAQKLHAPCGGMVFRQGVEHWAQSCNSGGVVSESWVMLK